MLALALTNKKDFMNKFLKTEIFDHFLLQEGIVVSFASYVIDGTITKGFYTDTEAEELGIKTFHFLPFLPIFLLLRYISMYTHLIKKLLHDFSTQDTAL